LAEVVLLNSPDADSVVCDAAGEARRRVDLLGPFVGGCTKTREGLGGVLVRLKRNIKVLANLHLLERVLRYMPAVTNRRRNVVFQLEHDLLLSELRRHRVDAGVDENITS
jgi:hypothetical protein